MSEQTFIVISTGGPQGPSGGLTTAGTNLNVSPAGTVNLDTSLTGLTAIGTGSLTATGTVQASDLTATDDLSVTDDATIGGDLSITGGLKSTANATTVSTQNTNGTTTSTSYTATLSGGTACGLAFTAPLSGAVLIHNTSETFNSGSGLSYCTIQVKTGASIGSGTDVVAASDNESVASQSSSGVGQVRATATRLVTGLTPGSSYNVQQLFRVTSSTGTFGKKTLIVQPLV